MFDSIKQFFTDPFGNKAILKRDSLLAAKHKNALLNINMQNITIEQLRAELAEKDHLIELSHWDSTPLEYWRTTDTTLAEKWTDEFLLENMTQIRLKGGCGSIAELMKRFERLKAELAEKDLLMEAGRLSLSNSSELLTELRLALEIKEQELESLRKWIANTSVGKHPLKAKAAEIKKKRGLPKTTKV